MNRRLVLAGGCSLLFLPVLAGCDRVSSLTYRFRTTIEVETPNGVVKGSAVRELSYTKSYLPFGQGELYPRDVRGEAVVVNIPGGPIFALIDYGQLRTRSGDGELLAWVDGHPDADYGDIGNPRIPELNKMKVLVDRQFKWVLPRDQWPRFVHFRDIDDPTTVEPVDPNHIRLAVGEVFKIRRIMIQITDEPVTWGIKKIIPSFGPETNFDDWYKSLPLGSPRRISKENFIVGV